MKTRSIGSERAYHFIYLIQPLLRVGLFAFVISTTLVPVTILWSLILVGVCVVTAIIMKLLIGDKVALPFFLGPDLFIIGIFVIAWNRSASIMPQLSLWFLAIYILSYAFRIFARTNSIVIGLVIAGTVCEVLNLISELDLSLMSSVVSQWNAAQMDRVISSLQPHLPFAHDPTGILIGFPLAALFAGWGSTLLFNFVMLVWVGLLCLPTISHPSIQMMAPLVVSGLTVLFFGSRRWFWTCAAAAAGFMFLLPGIAGGIKSNSYVLVLDQFGAIGFVCFLLFCLHALLLNLRLLKDIPKSHVRHRTFALWCLASQLSFHVSGLFSEAILVPIVMGKLVVLLAVVFYLLNRYDQDIVSDDLAL